MFCDVGGSRFLGDRFFYQYDGFNRLVRINLSEGGTVPLEPDPNEPSDPNYVPDPNVPGPCGPTLAEFVYDGFGRLIQVVRRDVQEPRQAQVETYYYDGVRRIREELDDDPADANSPIAAREYVWGPEYVDEALCLIDRGTGVPPGSGVIYYYLQDANYNVVALLDPNGAVLAQYQYEPYGAVVAADVDPNAPANRLGHQGLFYERLYYDPNVPLTAPALEPSAPLAPAPPLGVYVVRNRVLLPHLGRWAQRDMNETALPILTALAFNAQTTGSLLTGFSAQGHYSDGMNLYAYLASNPVNLIDPLGLDVWDDPFAEVDEIIFALTGGRAAAAHHAMGMIGQMAQKVATAALQATIAAMFPPYGLYLSIESAAMAVEDMLSNGVSWENSAILGLSVFGIRGTAGATVAQGRWALGKMVSGIRRGYGAVGRQYAAMRMARSGFSGPPGNSRVARFARSLDDGIVAVQRHWYGTRSSIKYHWEKHAKKFGLTVEEYTEDAVAFWAQNSSRARQVGIGGVRAPGTRIGYRIEGSPGGIFTSDGKIVTFWYD